MKSRFTHLLPCLFLMLFLQGAQATPASDAQLQAIARMGELNGIALQCRFIDQVRRIKQVLIQHLPKQRALGEWFEHKTNESFTRLLGDNTTCPGLIEFERDLDAASQQLEQAFAS